MAHYALLNENNTVISVITGRDENDTEGGVENWEKYYSDILGKPVFRTSYNTRGGVHYNPETGEPSLDQSKALLGNYAGIGFRYYPELDAFISPKPFDSWTLDETIFGWVAPIPMPNDGGVYVWDESEGDWVEVVSEAT